jgi:hypothetical protein
VKTTERDFGIVHLVDDALEVLDESGVGEGPLLQDLRAARPIAEEAIAIEWAMFGPPRYMGSSSINEARSALSPIAARGRRGWPASDQIKLGRCGWPALRR